MGGSTPLFWTLLPAIMLVAMALAEWRWPRRVLLLGRLPRWTTHALLTLSNRATIWLLARIIAVPAAALWAEEQGFGLLNMLALPIWAEILIAFILLDFALWFQHLATHKVPLLWHMHKVHHADRDLDASTALRFHPFEIFLSTLWKAFWVVALGVPALVFIAFESWLAANALFNHSNLNLPRWLDRAIRPFLVTPDMHLVHHSTLPGEQQRNYGFALTIWDRIFGTYAAVSTMGRDAQTIGLAEVQDEAPARIGWSLKFPLT
jgi:sterol desaturase/sphingolipid hydroxylase (fatty acid hydroxylase superfamily)